MNRDAAWYAMVTSGVAGVLMIIAALPDLLPIWAGLLFVWVLLALSKRIFRPTRQGRCLVCGYQGPLSTVLQTMRGGLLALLLLLAMLVPGVLYIIWRWNAPICPRCRSVNRAIIDPE